MPLWSIDAQHHRHHHIAELTVVGQANLAHHADLDPAVGDIGADIQAIQGPGEIHHVLAGLTEPAIARQQQQARGQQGQAAEQEGADDKGFARFAHAVSIG
ncbi:hypothetical protein D3C86_1548890 [compost metagenome]